MVGSLCCSSVYHSLLSATLTPYPVGRPWSLVEIMWGIVAPSAERPPPTSSWAPLHDRTCLLIVILCSQACWMVALSQSISRMNASTLRLSSKGTACSSHRSLMRQPRVVVGCGTTHRSYTAWVRGHQQALVASLPCGSPRRCTCDLAHQTYGCMSRNRSNHSVRTCLQSSRNPSMRYQVGGRAQLWSLSWWVLEHHHVAPAGTRGCRCVPSRTCYTYSRHRHRTHTSGYSCPAPTTASSGPTNLRNSSANFLLNFACWSGSRSAASSARVTAM